MIDQLKNQPMRVRGTSRGARIPVALDQLDAVCRVLDQGQVRYWLDNLIYSFPGEPQRRDIELHIGTDVEVVQTLLDQAE